MAHISSLPCKLNNKKVFSRLDLVSAFHQIPIHPDDVKKTAITTPFGLFEYKMMPFGFKNASSTFQRYMYIIFKKLSCVFVYIDDILVYFDDEKSHINDLAEVFAILKDNNLKLSLEKCSFMRSQVNFLRYKINSHGRKPTDSKINHLKSFPFPNDVSSLFFI